VSAKRCCWCGVADGEGTCAACSETRQRARIAALEAAGDAMHDADGATAHRGARAAWRKVRGK
jgi:recombinational DNA repair protein RecR